MTQESAQPDSDPLWEEAAESYANPPDLRLCPPARQLQAFAAALLGQLNENLPLEAVTQAEWRFLHEFRDHRHRAGKRHRAQAGDKSHVCLLDVFLAVNEQLEGLYITLSRTNLNGRRGQPAQQDAKTWVGFRPPATSDQ